MKLKSTFLFLALFIISNTNLLGQSYIYQEEFNSSGSWTQDNNDTRELYIANGKYYFQYKGATGSREFTTRTFYIDKSKDFEIETSILKNFWRTRLWDVFFV